MVGTVLTRRSSMIRGLVSATKAMARERVSIVVNTSAEGTHTSTVSSNAISGIFGLIGLYRRVVMTLESYRRVVAVAAALLALIVFTGAAVRLTDSGLGCEDWPTCNDDELIPAASFHGWIEFGNRLLSIAVSAAVGAAVLTARRLVPARPDLVRWAMGLVAGVLAQILLGGVTVLLDLHPIVVSAHFLLSAVLMWNVMVLLWKAQGPADRPRAQPPSAAAVHSRVQIGLAVVLLVIGTLVTGSGPNSGDIRADRLGFDLQTIARVHGVAAWVFVASLVLLLFRHRHDSNTRWGRLLLATTVGQGAIGYWQYATGVPPLLVEFHVIGAIAVWCATVWFHLQHLTSGVETTATVGQT